MPNMSELHHITMVHETRREKRMGIKHNLTRATGGHWQLFSRCVFLDRFPAWAEWEEAGDVCAVDTRIQNGVNTLFYHFVHWKNSTPSPPTATTIFLLSPLPTQIQLRQFTSATSTGVL
mmetsp:Transcript_6762/g.15477  ORF Transcript_6762/g.15477 Transcript_6762/m.15477 type:complete len:119 (+) Transcript_6762:684-1040(+)